ncbi:hypothetical protein NHQ30_002971 [Ciborinia camelliae]|nr:hypothetical protein NHQ30_002971 [Ciborinia camelliae]
MASSTLRDELKELWEDLPEDDRIKGSLKDSLKQQIARLRTLIATICDPEEDENAKFIVLEHHEDPTRPIGADRQPKLVLSSTKHLLNNCSLFSHVFDLKASDANFDRYDMVAYAPSAQNIRESEFAIKDKCIYLDELMKREFITQHTGYNSIAKLESQQIISHLVCWQRWLSQNKLPTTCTLKQQQETLNVAGFFGASPRSLALAAMRYGLEMPEANSSGSINIISDDESGDKKADESSTCDALSNVLNNISDEPNDDPPFNPLATNGKTPSYSRSVLQESISQVPLPPKVGTIEARKYVVILKKELSAEMDKKLAETNWGKGYTPTYIRCWKMSLHETAPRLLELFNAREKGSNKEVGKSELCVGDSHVWDPIFSEEKKPYCHYPQLFLDEVNSDFSDQWEGHEEVNGYTHGRKNGKDILWLAVQFWILFADTNGVGDPPQSSQEELAMKEEMVHAVGKWLGATREKLHRFDVTWGTKMKSDDPNNAQRKRAHGFGGEGYYPNKRGFRQ